MKLASVRQPTSVITFYGVRNIENDELVRDHFLSKSDADSFVSEWLGDGGRDIFEVVFNQETITNSGWYSCG